MTVANTATTPDLDLSYLLETDSIKTRFQPIISMREKIVIGLEALSYGIDPDTGNTISPDILFNEAEKQGLTLKLDRVCRKKAMSNFSRIFPQGTDILLWLNIETSILDNHVVGTGRLLETAKQYGLRPYNLVIEIVESDASDLSALKRFVDLQKKHGFFIALDDVGTGHSNLERIAMIKPDIIKIDRFLIRDLDKEYHKREVVRSLANLAGGIGALVVAEGIETLEEAETVLDIDIHLHQGYYYAHPDDPIAKQFSHCESNLKHLAEHFSYRRLKNFSSRQRYFKSIVSSVHEIVQRLEETPSSDYETVLTELIPLIPRLECVYILGEDGIQVTETVCNTCKLERPYSTLFRPAPKYTDLSLKDYYLLIKAGLERYVSEPYISRASSNLCVTVSHGFESTEGVQHILCADYDCEDQECTT